MIIIAVITFFISVAIVRLSPDFALLAAPPFLLLLLTANLVLALSALFLSSLLKFVKTHLDDE